MSPLKLRVIEEASKEVSDSYNWYEKKKSGLGEEFLIEVDSCFKHILNYPNGFENKYKNFRFIALNKFPYVILYEVFEKEIVIFTVRSTNKDPEELQKLLDNLK